MLKCILLLCLDHCTHAGWERQGSPVSLAPSAANHQCKWWGTTNFTLVQLAQFGICCRWLMSTLQSLDNDCIQHKLALNSQEVKIIKVGLPKAGDNSSINLLNSGKAWSITLIETAVNSLVFIYWLLVVAYFLWTFIHRSKFNMLSSNSQLLWVLDYL